MDMAGFLHRTLLAATLLPAVIVAQALAQSAAESGREDRVDRVVGVATAASSGEARSVDAEGESPDFVTVSMQNPSGGGGTAKSPSTTSTPRQSNPSPSTPQNPLDAFRNSLASNYHSDSLYSAPAMFGKFFFVPMSVEFFSPMTEASGDIPLAGSCGRLDIADNNKPVTMDRVFVLYNHFQNALDSELGASSRTFSVDRCTLGFEKAFLDGQWSIEMRLPISSRVDVAVGPLDSSFSMAEGERVGNLAVILKRMLYETEDTAIAAGIGIDTPTGGDVEVFGGSYNVHNDATHCVPYIGMLRTRGRFFYQGFLDVDVPLNGDRIDVIDSMTMGLFTEQTLMHLDLSGGYWLYHNPGARRLTGLAALTEFHYTTALNDTDVVGIEDRQSGIIFENRRGRMSLASMTIGLHADWANNTTFRVGTVFPLSTGLDRTFDAEIQAQYERRF
jgi:hypothetical protein